MAGGNLMNLRKVILYSFLFMILLLLGTACSQANSSADSNTASDVTLVFAHAYTDNDHRAQGYEKWAELVNERSDGSIQIDIHSNATLVDFPEGYDSISTGTVDMFANISLYMSSAIPELEQFDPIGIYNPNEWQELNEAVSPLMDEILEGHNMKYLHTDYQGPSAIMSVTPDPILTAEDWEGVRWRDSGVHLGKVIQELGGSSSTIPVGELTTAISTGVVDAVFQGYSFIRSLNYYETMDHIVMMPETSNSFGVIAINLDTWNSLSEEQQKILNETGDEILPVYEEIGKESYDEIIDLIEGGQASFRSMTNEEEQEILGVVEKFFPELYDEANEKGKELYEVIEQYR